MRNLITAVSFASFIVAAPIAGAQSSTAGVSPDELNGFETQRAWWRAFAVADTAYLRATSLPALSLTVSSGRTYDLSGMLGESASYKDGARLKMTWENEAIRTLAPNVAVVTSRATEVDGPTSSVYRYLTLLERHDNRWKVVAAQSTRELTFTPRAYTMASENLAELSGSYQTPRGMALQVVVRDSALALIEPSGKELRLEPIAADLFELPALSPSNGLVRLMFTRDNKGHVIGLTRLLSGSVNTFPRIK